MNKNQILGVRIDDVYEKGISFHLKRFINSEKFNMITPVNPEMLILARKNAKFKEILNKSELTTCDAAGVSLAFKLKSANIRKAPGSSLIYDILAFASENNKKVFFLGAKDDVNKKARENAKKNYSKLKIEGYSPPREKRNNIEFQKDEQIKILGYLREFKPDILCAFFGAPFQETWFSANRKQLQKLKIKIGVSLGGTADFLSGCTKKAPGIWQELNLEWLYRLFTEKGRFKRFITRIPFFALLAVNEAVFKKID